MIFGILLNFLLFLRINVHSGLNLIVWPSFPTKIPRYKALHQSHSNATGCHLYPRLIGWQLTLRVQLLYPPSSILYTLDRHAAPSMRRELPLRPRCDWCSAVGGYWEVRIPHPAVGAPLMDGTERVSSSVDESRVWARPRALQWERAAVSYV